MPGLFDLLSTSARSLGAQTYGLTVTGQNIANLNTEGYVRRSLSLAEVPPTSGGGVQVLGVQSQRDLLTEGRLQQQFQAEQREGAIADSLAVVETAIGGAGSSIDARLTAFFDTFSALSVDPTSAVARDGVLQQADQLAAAFHDMSSSLDSAAREADAQLRGTVDQINTLASHVAELNAAIGSGGADADVEALKDDLGVSLKALAGLAAITVMNRTDGGADVTIGTGRALVIGGNQYALSVTSSGPSGFGSVESGGFDITSELNDGRLGGLLHIRDTVIPDYKDQLDQLAFSVVQEVNALHQAGFDLNGGTGNNFFAPLGSAAGAAAAMSVDSAVAGDTDLIAASATGTAGDNGTGKAIAALRDAQVAGGGTTTFVGAWSQLVYHVGSDSATAQSNQKVQQNIISSLERLRDSVSGVSLDDEAATMLKFQRAYEANAKYFSTINATLDVLMNMLG